MIVFAILSLGDSIALGLAIATNFPNHNMKVGPERLNFAADVPAKPPTPLRNPKNKTA
jgi:hypothetical protein